MSNDNTSQDIPGQSGAIEASASQDSDGFADAMAALAVVAFAVIAAVLWVSSR